MIFGVKFSLPGPTDCSAFEEMSVNDQRRSSSMWSMNTSDARMICAKGTEKNRPASFCCFPACTLKLLLSWSAFRFQA